MQISREIGSIFAANQHLGSSLTVYPAAAFPEVAKQNGATLIIVNQQATDIDPIADLVIHAGIGNTMASVLG